MTVKLVDHTNYITTIRIFSMLFHLISNLHQFHNNSTKIILHLRCITLRKLECKNLQSHIYVCSFFSSQCT